MSSRKPVKSRTPREFYLARDDDGGAVRVFRSRPVKQGKDVSHYDHLWETTVTDRCAGQWYATRGKTRFRRHVLELCRRDLLRVAGVKLEPGELMKVRLARVRDRKAA